MGILLGFIIILYLNTKNIDMGLSLFVGAIIAGLFSMKFLEIFITIYKSLIDPLTIQLVVIVAVISGIGYILKETGDFDQMINSLIVIFKDAKILSMLLPALVGTLSVPGGAILSAPMVDESGSRISMNKAKKTAVNIFFRHIGFIVYPLYDALILTTNLAGIEKISLIKYNISIIVIGVISSYFVFFKGIDEKSGIKIDTKITQEIKNFFWSFSPVIIILVASLIFKIPFYIAVFLGLFVAVSKRLKGDNKIKEIFKRYKLFFKKGVNYNLVGLLAGVMSFKGIVEASGSVTSIAEYLTNSGLPLSIMVIGLGLITGFLTGINMAALGLLMPIFLPLIPIAGLVPYLSLLFVSSFIGYLMSPIHLCLVLTKEFFQASYWQVYKYLLIPVVLMIITGLVQVILFT